MTTVLAALTLTAGCNDTGGVRPPADGGIRADAHTGDSGRGERDGTVPVDVRGVDGALTLDDGGSDGAPASDAPSTPDSGSATSGSVGGIVVQDPPGDPASDMTVSIGSLVATTDNAGRFFFPDVPSGDDLVLRAAGEGRSTGVVRLDLAPGAHVEATVVVAGANAIIMSSAHMGGTVSSWDGYFTATLPPSALRDSGGALFTGTAYIWYAIVRSADAMAAAPPMVARDDSGGEVDLESYGMVDVQVSNAATGERLTLAEPATLSFYLGVSPTPGTTELPLYSFDETAGVWRLEGTGSYASGVFTATVTHLSWWNCDQPLADKSCVRGRLVTSAGAPLGALPVVMSGVSYLGAGQALTAADGSFCINVKRDATSKLALWSAGPATAVSTGAAPSSSLTPWTTTVHAPATAAACDGSGGACLDIGDQTVLTSGLTCVQGTFGAMLGEGASWEVRDSAGGLLGSGSWWGFSTAFCATVPSGATFQLMFYGGGTCTPVSETPYSLTGVPATCSTGGCQDVGTVCR